MTRKRRSVSGDDGRMSMQITFEAWRGRYSDSPRAVSEALAAAAELVIQIRDGAVEADELNAAVIGGVR